MKVDVLYHIYLEGIGYHTNSPPLMGGDRGEGDVIF